MVYTNIFDASRTHFIHISSNYNDNNKRIGTKINIKTYIPADISLNYNGYNFTSFYGYNNIGHEKFKDRVILSGKSDNRSLTLITNQNLVHNIKFININNNFNKPRILFQKYNIVNNQISNKKYLFNSILDNENNSHIDLTKINLNDIELNLGNTDNDIIGINDNITYLTLNHLIYYFNYYKNYDYSDYYKLKFSDFIDLSYSLQNKIISEFSYNNLIFNFQDISCVNNFSDNNLLNYDVNNFKNIYNHADNSLNTVKLKNINSDISYTYDNIFLYNQLNNITKIKFKSRYYNHSDTDIDITEYDNSINFIVLKDYDYYSKYSGKIILNKDFTYLNSRILGYNNDFYTTNQSYKTISDNGKVYLSLGNSITGITQKDLYTKMKLDIDIQTTNSETSSLKTYNNVKKIYFTNNVVSTNVPTELKNKNYLLEENYDYDYINLTYNNIQESNIKKIDINLLNLYHSYNQDYSYNIYKNRFNNLEILNNDISYDYFETNYNSDNIEFYINSASDISYTTDPDLDIKLKFNNVDRANSTLINTPITNNLINYDFRYNYSKDFDLDTFYTIKYNYPLSELLFNGLEHYKYNLLLNSHKIISTTNIVTTAASDFTNVDCIFIYHDQDNENTPDEYKYPNNNIEISSNTGIDTLSRAIELLPGARTATSNSVFIPAQNGSNLSRKQIQGLIGFNNIPKLLSIEPYDPNFINGRGFVNQYQINDTCLSYEDKVKNKVNIHNKKVLENSNQGSRRINYANLVRSRGRNTISKECANNINSGESQVQSIDYSKITNYKTPFKMFYTGRGKYLGPQN